MIDYSIIQRRTSRTAKANVVPITGADGKLPAEFIPGGNLHWLGGEFGDGTNVIQAGDFVIGTCPFSGTIFIWDILTWGGTGSIEFDVWKDTFANWPASVADTIVASAPPLISSGVTGQSTTLTGWTTAVTAGDRFVARVVSASVFTKASLMVYYQ